jgi:hypothetical protein
MKHWRHKAALEWFARRPDWIVYSQAHKTSITIGEITFKTAIKNGWLQRANSIEKGPWWQVAWKLTDAGSKALKEMSEEQ